MWKILTNLNDKEDEYQGCKMHTGRQVTRVARFCKEAPALSTGALLGNLEVVRLLGPLGQKENAYLGSFSWTQRTLKVKCGGHLEL